MHRTRRYGGAMDGWVRVFGRDEAVQETLTVLSARRSLRITGQDLLGNHFKYFVHLLN